MEKWEISELTADTEDSWKHLWTWRSAFPKEGTQAEVTASFTQELIPSHLPPFSGRCHLHCSFYLIIKLRSFWCVWFFSHRHHLAHLRAGKLVKALWPPREPRDTLFLATAEFCNLKKLMIVSPGMLRLNWKSSPVNPFSLSAANDPYKSRPSYTSCKCIFPGCVTLLRFKRALRCW